MVLNVCVWCSISDIGSCTFSPILYKSPSIKVIISSDDLVTFNFFRYPSFSRSLYHFTWKGVLSYWSPPPCFDHSSSSLWGEGDFWLFSEPCSSCCACSFVARSTSTRTFSLDSFFLFSTNSWTFYLDASFFFLHIFSSPNSQLGGGMPLCWPTLGELCNSIIHS